MSRQTKHRINIVVAAMFYLTVSIGFLTLSDPTSSRGVLVIGTLAGVCAEVVSLVVYLILEQALEAE